MSRVVLSEHRTRAAARISRKRWNHRLSVARAGDARAQNRLRAEGVHNFDGRAHEEKGGRHTSQKWGVFFEPHTPMATDEQPPGPPTPPRPPLHRPVG